jgi:uncharacterized protein YigE (DUF2233 family)
MKHLLTILLFLFFLSKSILFSQETVSQNDFVFNNFKIDFIVIKVDDFILKNLFYKKNENHESNSDLVRSLLARDSSFLLLNACITDSVCDPLGLFVNDYRIEKPVNYNNGNGNFYLKPNGLFLVTDSEIKIAESSQIKDFSRVRLGIQSGPLLLDNGNVNPSFNINSVNKKIRLGVGVFSKKNEDFLVFIKSEDEINFYDFSMIFQNKFKCKNALCLESQGCVINFPDNFDLNNSNKFCNYFFLDL